MTVRRVSEIPLEQTGCVCQTTGSARNEIPLAGNKGNNGDEHHSGAQYEWITSR